MSILLLWLLLKLGVWVHRLDTGDRRLLHLMLAYILLVGHPSIAHVGVGLALHGLATIVCRLTLVVAILLLGVWGSIAWSLGVALISSMEVLACHLALLGGRLVG